MYKHTSPNGKCYIGITGQRPERRWGPDGSKYSSQRKFYNAIKKYGLDNFQHEILLSGLTLQEASDKEIELIAQYDSVNSGYNCATGGMGAGGVHSVQVYCEETQRIYSSIAEAAELLEPV